eukprot:12759785-Ditylum_brightwellii.AAC.1
METISSNKPLVNLYQPGGALAGVVGQDERKERDGKSQPEETAVHRYVISIEALEKRWGSIASHRYKFSANREGI